MVSDAVDFSGKVSGKAVRFFEFMGGPTSQRLEFCEGQASIDSKDFVDSNYHSTTSQTKNSHLPVQLHIFRIKLIRLQPRTAAIFTGFMLLEPVFSTRKKSLYCV